MEGARPLCANESPRAATKAGGSHEGAKVTSGGLFGTAERDLQRLSLCDCARPPKAQREALKERLALARFALAVVAVVVVVVAVAGPKTLLARTTPTGSPLLALRGQFDTLNEHKHEERKRRKKNGFAGEADTDSKWRGFFGS